MKVLWLEVRILLEKEFHPTMTPINNGFIFLLHLITHSLCENRQRCHGSWLKIVLKSTSHKKCCFFSACTRKKFWQNKSFLYLENQPSGSYIMRWLTVAKKIYPNVCLCGEQKCENEWQCLQSILYSLFFLLHNLFSSRYP